MYRIGPINRRTSLYSREKCLIGLVLITLCVLCFGGIFLLPDNFGGDRVLRVYKQIQRAGPEIFMPAPPLAGNAPKNLDPRFMGDREKLAAKIKEELGELLDKPQLQPQQLQDVVVDSEESEVAAPAPDSRQTDYADKQQQPQQQGVAPPLKNSLSGVGADPAEHNKLLENDNLPVANINVQLPLGGHADPDASIEEKRQKVKEVSHYI